MSSAEFFHFSNITFAFLEVWFGKQVLLEYIWTVMGYGACSHYYERSDLVMILHLLLTIIAVSLSDRCGWQCVFEEFTTKTRKQKALNRISEYLRQKNMNLPLENPHKFP